jgi:hypothetical protein
VDAEEAAALIVPAREDLLEIYPVSDAVNHAANDSAELIERVAELAEPDVEASKRRKAAKAKIDDGQASLF